MIDLSERNRFFAFIVGTFAALCAIAWLAPGAFKSLALAFALAYLLDPAVDWLEHRKVPRVASILLIMVLVLGILTLALSFLIPYLWKEAVQFVHEAPGLAEKALNKIAGWSLLPEEMTRSVPELLKEIKGRLLAGGWSTIKPLLSGLLEATSGLVGGILAIVSLVVIPVFFFFILKDLDPISNSFYRFVPDSIENSVREYLQMVNRVLSGFIRGQILVALSLAVLYSIGLGITGIRFGVLIGVVAGLMFIIPYVGTVIGVLASGMVLLVDFSGWGQVMGVAATFGIAQAIEGYILTPRIVGNRVGLNQLETLVAIMVGGEMGGLAGLIIAIPAGGIFKQTFHMLKPGEGQAVDAGTRGHADAEEARRRGGEGANSLAEEEKGRRGEEGKRGCKFDV